MCGDEGSWVRQFVVPPHPEGEEDDSGQAYDGNQGVKQGAEELGLLGVRVGGGCEGRNRHYVSQPELPRFVTTLFMSSWTRSPFSGHSE